MTCPARTLALVIIEYIRLLAIILCGIVVIVVGYAVWLVWTFECWVREVGTDPKK